MLFNIINIDELLWVALRCEDFIEIDDEMFVNSITTNISCDRVDGEEKKYPLSYSECELRQAAFFSIECRISFE